MSTYEESAFPEVDSHQEGVGGEYWTRVQSCGGMTLRDYFAAKAMQELLSQDVYDHFDGVAKDAYMMANAMLKARNVGKE